MKDDEKPSTGITRREALKKFGLYVPPTLVVLTAAPRAFAVSPEPETCVAELDWIISDGPLAQTFHAGQAYDLTIGAAAEADEWHYRVVFSAGCQTPELTVTANLATTGGADAEIQCNPAVFTGSDFECTGTNAFRMDVSGNTITVTFTVVTDPPGIPVTVPGPITWTFNW